MKKAFYGILSLFFGGCTLIELPVYVEPAEEKLVISSVMVGRQAIVVTASRSFSALSGRDLEDLQDDFVETLLVRNGEVILKRPFKTDTLAGSSDIPGFYAGFTPELFNGDRLELSVKDSIGGHFVTAVTTLMAPVEIDSVSADSIGFREFTLPQVKVWINDPPEDNWFSMHVYAVNELGGILNDSLFFEGGENTLHSEVFSDRVADSTLITRDFAVDSNTFYNDTLVVLLSNIEEGYFRFLDARRRTGGIIASLANEPINYPTNVEGGYGYFSAHQPTAFLIYFDRFSRKMKSAPKHFAFKSMHRLTSRQAPPAP